MIRRLLGCACALALLASSSARAAEPPRAISQLTERLYVVSAGEQSTVALVTSGGILIADPLDAATAAWLRTELSTRFPGVPVRYVVLTSAEFGRTSGVTTFLPGAALLAHAGINGALVKASQTLPPELVAIDANRDGRLERSEWISTELSALLSNADGDNDGTLTPRELWKLIPYATETFRDDRLLTLGNETGSPC